MKRVSVLIIAGIVSGLLAGDADALLARQSAAGASGGTPVSAAPPAMLEQYCITCHNQRANTGGLALDTMDFDNVGAHPEVWEKVVRKLRTGMMPPSGAVRPDREVLDAFAAELETRLDRAAAANPNPGSPLLSRLNRTEYANAVRDLLALDVDVTVLLPGDESSGGFDNIAEALGVSPALAQGYVSSAMKISRRAVGDRTMLPTVARYQAEGSQDSHVDGLPLGTRGGVVVRHTFPLDAEYQLSVSGNVFMLDGVKLEVENLRNFTLPIQAGPHTLGVAIVDDRRPAGVDELWQVTRGGRGAPGITIDGPFNPAGPGETPSRRQVFICYPETSAEEPACAERIVRNLARRAYRRPATEAEMEDVMRFYAQGRDAGGFETGVERALAGILVSPGFVFRSEEEPADLADGTVYRIDDIALASRLSFFLWSSIPDEGLLDLAFSGRLGDPGVLDAEVRRMLLDPKADALVDNFASQWLSLRTLDEADPLRETALANRLEREGFTENLRQAFRRETELLFESVVREDRSVIDLIDADYTFVDEQLARHYGIPGVTGTYFRRVSLDDDSPRRGLLGHGSVLTLTSAPDRTSPVVRGQWILQNILGSPAPDPPPAVETNLDEDPEALVKRTLRERLEAHRANPVCASCHRIMDPIGLAMEHFDRIGQWREFDGGAAIDSTGQLVDGTRLEGVTDLRQALLTRSEAFVTTAVEKLMTYALGRGVRYYDMPAVREIVRDAADEDYRFSSLVHGIVRSMPFQMKKKEAEDALSLE